MRLNIGLCKHCSVDKDACKYRNDIRIAVSCIKHGGVLSHNCAIYKNCWTEGDAVEVELKSLIVADNVMYGYDAEWKSVGFVSGTVCGYSRGWFIVALDEPATISMPERGCGWDTARNVVVTHTRRRANKIVRKAKP